MLAHDIHESSSPPISETLSAAVPRLRANSGTQLETGDIGAIIDHIRWGNYQGIAETEKGWRTLGMQSRSAGSDCAACLSAEPRGRHYSTSDAKDLCPTTLTRSPKVPWQQHALPVTNTTHGGEVIYSQIVNKLNLVRGRIQRWRKTRLCLQKPLWPHKQTLQTTRIGNAFSLSRPFAGSRQDCFLYAEIQ